MGRSSSVRVLAVCALVLTGPAIVGRAAAQPTAVAPSGISAVGVAAIDGTTGTLLWGKGADTSRPIASITKIMTAVVVLRSPGVDLNRVVAIAGEYHDYVVRTGASSAGLRVGDRLTVRQLLYAMLLPSGCDAAYALADSFGTGATRTTRIANFIARMNTTARSLGLTGTRFASFDGNSPAKTHYSTPRSLARLAAYALTQRAFATVVGTTSTRQVARTALGNPRTYTWSNSNALLTTYAGAVGVKTGTSKIAGPSLVFAARRDNQYVVGVVLGSTSSAQRFDDARRILDWALD